MCHTCVRPETVTTVPPDPCERFIARAPMVPTVGAQSASVARFELRPRRSVDRTRFSLVAWSVSEPWRPPLHSEGVEKLIKALTATKALLPAQAASPLDVANDDDEAAN
jgi:hypothetical protein